MQKESSLSYYIAQAGKLESSKFEKKIRIAILGSFTLNGLEETFRVKCASEKLIALLMFQDIINSIKIF